MKLQRRLVLVFFLLFSCGSPHKSRNDDPRADRADEDRYPLDEGPLNDELIFAAVDSVAMPWTSTIYSLSLQTHNLKPLLRGEGGDPALFNSETGVFFFNRSFESQNFREFSVTADSYSFGSRGKSFLQISPQRSFAGGRVGDPMAIVPLDSQEILLGNYSEGSLTVVDRASGEQRERIDADWNLPMGINLRPTSFLARPHLEGERQVFYVLHQGLGAESGLVYANGSQALFKIVRHGSRVQAETMPGDSSKIEGISLHGSLPAVIPRDDGHSYYLVSLCSRFVAAGTRAAGKEKCRSAVELFDSISEELTLLWDFTGTELYMNGSVTRGPNDRSVYASVEHELAGELVQSVILIDPHAHSLEVVYRYEANSGGFWSMIFDRQRGNLYIGDIARSSVGQWVVLTNNTESSRIPLPAVPLTAVIPHAIVH